MDHFQRPEQRIKKDASTQTTDRDFFLLEKTRDASTQTSDGGIFLLEHTRDASTQTIEEPIFLETTTDESTHTSEVGFGIFELIHSNANNVNVSLDTIQQNRKRNASTYQLFTTHEGDAHKRSRNEICHARMNDKDISTSSEHGDKNHGTTAASSQNALANIGLASDYPEYKKIKEPHSHNSDILESNHSYNNRFFTIGQNASSDMNIIKNEIAVDNATDSGSSKGNFSFDNNLTVSNSLCSSKNSAELNFSVENILKPSTKLQILREKKKTDICLPCNKTISEHVKVLDTKNVYTCCQCKYKFKTEYFLLKHISKHYLLTKAFYCNVCKVSYSYLDPHGSGEMCNVCQLNFECKIQLEDHYLSHEERHLTYCRNCQEKIEKHETKMEGSKTEGKKFYQCCMCKRGSMHLSRMLEHFYIHSSLRLFKCNVCGQSFKHKHHLKCHLKMHR